MQGNPTLSNVTQAIKDDKLPSAALAIILYCLSAIDSNYKVTMNYVTIRTELGIKRTSFFNAMKAIREIGFLSKLSKQYYRVNVKDLLPPRLKANS